MKHSTIPARLAILVAVLASLLATSMTSVHAAHSAAPMTLRITWFRWPPADYLQVVANLYTKSHPNVKIIVNPR